MYGHTLNIDALADLRQDAPEQGGSALTTFCAQFIQAASI
jgi:hypothetical protein